MRNELLKEALMRAHKTVEDVAQAIDVDPKTVQRWINGRIPHARHRWAVAQLLDMRDDDLWDIQELPKQPALEIIMPYASSSLQVAQKPCITSPSSKTSSTLPDLDLLMRSRREVLKEILHTACATLALSPSILLSQDAKERLLAVTAHRSYVDAETLDCFSAITDQYWKLSESSSLDLISGISGHFATITQLLHESHSTPIYEKLCALASENALLLGKTFSSIREYDLAWGYYKFALKVARDVQHTDLWAAGIGRIALLHIHWGQPQQALPLLHEVQRQELYNQRLCAWLPAIEAEIQAKSGNADECLRSLDRSKSVTLPISLADDVYRTGFNQSRAAGYEGSCFVLLRQPERALPALDKAASLGNPTSLLRRSHNLADRGAVYAQLGDVKTACALMSEVLDVTEQSKSLIGLQKVFKGKKELDPWKESSEVKNLDERLHDLLIRLTKLKEQVH